MGTLRPGRMSAPGMTKPTEAIARARAGDAEAWGQLYRDYAPAIFRFCRRALPTREDAEDATMEIFMKLKDKLVQYDATRSFSAWLYKVGRITAGIRCGGGEFVKTRKRTIWKTC